MLPVLEVGGVVGGLVVVVDVLSVAVVVIEVVSAGRSSVFAHAASAKAREKTMEGRMKCMQDPQIDVFVRSDNRGIVGCPTVGVLCKHRTTSPKTDNSLLLLSLE